MQNPVFHKKTTDQKEVRIGTDMLIENRNISSIHTKREIMIYVTLIDKSM